MIIELQGGQKLEVQDGATPSQIDEVVSHIQSQGIQGDPWSMERAGQVLPMVGREALQGLTLGSADEIGAAAKGAASKLSGGDFQPAYEKALGEYNKAISRDQSNYPTSSVLANLGGGLVSGSAISAGLPAGLTEATIRAGAVTKGISQGAAIGGVTGFNSADPTNGESRMASAKGGAITGGVLGGLIPAAFGKSAPVTDISGQVKQGLLEGDPNATRATLGAQLGERISQEAQGAKQATNIAYDLANEANKSTRISSFHDITNNIDSHIADYQGTKGADLVNKITEDFRNSNPVQNVNQMFSGEKPDNSITYDALEGLRQRINKIPQTQEYIGAKSAAIRGFDSSVNDLMEKGLVKGDDAALSLIKDARAKNSYYMQNFGGKEANKVIKNYIQNEGENISPENLADAFTRVGKAGFTNIGAVKDIIGADSIPMLKQGMLANVRSVALGAEGDIQPKKLANSLYSLLNGNQSIAKQVFTPDEINQLTAVMNTASRMKGQSGLLSSAAGKLPIIGHFIGAPSQDKIVKQLANPAMQQTYKTPLGMLNPYSLGGAQ